MKSEYFSSPISVQGQVMGCPTKPSMRSGQDQLPENRTSDPQTLSAESDLN
jgi:hypothetical protein